jgi:hypothetical protein
MNIFNGRFVLVAGLLSVVLLHGNSARADDDHCKNIHAQIDLSTGTIVGNFRLNGTVAFAADSNGTAPTTAPANSSVFSGPLVITTPHGTLTVRETGMFSSRVGNPDGSVLVSWGDSASGTNFFAGVTGDLFFVGRRVDGVLLVKVTGTLCRP